MARTAVFLSSGSKIDRESVCLFLIWYFHQLHHHHAVPRDLGKVGLEIAF